MSYRLIATSRCLCGECVSRFYFIGMFQIGQNEGVRIHWFGLN